MQQIDLSHARSALQPQHVHRTVEVRMVDGEDFWLFVEAGSFQDMAHRMANERHLIGRLMGRAGEGFDSHRMVIPVERIKLVIDVDG